MTLHSPAAFLRPNSVALVGGSERVTSSGGAVLRNLLRNARQAGATRATVELKLETAARSVLITVQDDGPGIAPEQVQKLFQPFVTDGKPTGTGLGLYLCRRYIELMQGDMSVHSKPGSGACFTLRLPGRVAIIDRQTASVLEPA